MSVEGPPSPPSECAVGSEGCPCTGGGACDPGLSCLSNLCVDAGGGKSEKDEDEDDKGDEDEDDEDEDDEEEEKKKKKKKKKKKGRKRSFRNGGFLHGHAGAIIPMEERNFPPDLQLNGTWGFGGGYLLAMKNGFTATFGADFEHAIYKFRDDNFKGSEVRLVPEVRLGGGAEGKKRGAWGYGLFAAGLAAQSVSNEAQDNDDTDVGALVRIGGGAMVAVFQGLYLGLDATFDYTFIKDGEAEDDENSDRELLSIGARGVIGWNF